MNRHFLLLVSLFCLIVEATTLKCTTCHLRTQSDHCRRGFGVCLAQKHETCMSLRIYSNGSLQTSYMVCQRFCKNLAYNFNNRTYIHKCCNYDFCNFRL
ncbi:prostate and testis expressed protein 3 precursor [Rattus norvegicus]|uniref:Prostate and testis expressed 3 n=1 Tax=Rattus norvegicus TaxID=10116 RepID=H6TJC4_RAT|nr:prostate and testis expressed protein 3 precursor [Rattus norvegicus]ADX01590.1 prostate and testis expressed DJ [Rattus norvegicus]|eukprot:NP_001243458.1 prostate and testis expressed protein 3 precursor [Rattus norvegicus]